MTIKIEFPANRPDIAAAFAVALSTIGEVGVANTPKATHPAPAVTVQETSTSSVSESVAVPKTDPKSLFDELSPAGTADDVSGAETSGSPADAQVDHNGVAKDDRFCGTAAEPFYSSGKRSGQWKKRKGVSDADYDGWYASQLEPGAAQKTIDATPVDTSSAFGGQNTQPVAQGEPVPVDCGGFMGWVAAKQAAGLLTQDDIGRAYEYHNIVVTDLFPPAADSVVATNVGKLHAFLAPIVAQAGGA